MIETKKFKKGQIISNEGDFELWMYYIVSGRVGIYGGYNTEHRVVLSVNERCSFFGELGLKLNYNVADIGVKVFNDGILFDR